MCVGNVLLLAKGYLNVFLESKENSFENVLFPIEKSYVPVQYARSLTEASILLQHANDDTYVPIRQKVRLQTSNKLLVLWLPCFLMYAFF